MRLSTALTPRVIACAEDLREHIALPRGCLPEAEAMLKEYGVTLDITDEREAGQPGDFAFHGTLTSLLEQAVKALLALDTGVFVAPPGIGKTVVGTFEPSRRSGHRYCSPSGAITWSTSRSDSLTTRDP